MVVFMSYTEAPSTKYMYENAVFRYWGKKQAGQPQGTMKHHYLVNKYRTYMYLYTVWLCSVVLFYIYVWPGQCLQSLFFPHVAGSRSVMYVIVVCILHVVGNDYSWCKWGGVKRAWIYTAGGKKNCTCIVALFPATVHCIVQKLHQTVTLSKFLSLIKIMYISLYRGK